MIERLSFDFQAVRQILKRIARRQNEAKSAQIIRDATKAKIERTARKIQQLIDAVMKKKIELEKKIESRDDDDFRVDDVDDDSKELFLISIRKKSIEKTSLVVVIVVSQAEKSISIFVVVVNFVFVFSSSFQKKLEILKRKNLNYFQMTSFSTSSTSN